MENPTDKTNTETAQALTTPPGSALRMPRWKMMDVVYLHRRWKPRALIVGIFRGAKDPNEIRYDVITESLGNGSEGEFWTVTRDEWIEGMEWLRDEVTPRQWRESMAFLDEEFVEPKEWGEFRQRWEETGDPFLPFPGGMTKAWQIDQTYPQNSPVLASEPSEDREQRQF